MTVNCHHIVGYECRPCLHSNHGNNLGLHSWGRSGELINACIFHTSRHSRRRRTTPLLFEKRVSAGTALEGITQCVSVMSSIMEITRL